MGMLKFTQESNIILAEHTQVLNHIFEVGDALNTYTKCITSINRAVYATQLKNVRIDHSTTQNFYPAGVLAETTSFTATQHARNIHLGTWLGKWEVTWTKAKALLQSTTILALSRQTIRSCLYKVPQSDGRSSVRGQ